MDYEKKYKEALARAREIHVSKDVIEYLFPELQENEDERIRKGIIRNLEYLMDSAEGFVKDELKERIVWLEKQGEQVSAIRWYDASFIPQEMKELLVEWNSSDATWHDVAFYHANTKTFLNYERELKNVTRWCYVEDLFEEQSNVKETGISQHDKKTCVEWSEEDSSKVQRICKYLDEAKKYYADITEVRECIDWLKSLKDRVLPQPKQKWSEEDNVMIRCITLDLELLKNRDDGEAGKAAYQSEIEWLKSIKDRYTWKPSDAQMIALNDVITNWHLSNVNERILKGLQDQLKKLK